MQTKNRSVEVRKSASGKTQKAHSKSTRQKRHTITLDLSKGAYSLVVAYTKLFGWDSPEEVALASLHSSVHCMVTSMYEGESRELFGLPKEEKNV